MKRLVILIALVLVAGVAGIVRSKNVVHFGELASHDSAQTQAREEIRKNYDLSPGGRVELRGINGWVKIETSDTKTADVLIQRTAPSPESLSRRQINIDADANSLRISSERGDASFFSRLFGSNPREDVTLRLPKQVSLEINGVNGAVTVGELEGLVEIHGINGRVQIASANGGADLRGINGNIHIGLQQLSRDGASLSGINGNIELELGQAVNADFDAHGMNGNVMSDLPDVVVEKERGGRYSAHIGAGGNSISAKGINGNIRLTRGTLAVTTTMKDFKAVDGSGQR